MFSKNIGIAILIGILASCSTVIGMNIQKYALTHASPITSSLKRTCIWFIGLSFVILATIGDLLALSLAPQSIVAPLGSLAIVMNAFIAPCMIGETLSKNIFLGSSFTTVGCLLATTLAPKEGNQTSEDLIQFYASRWSFIYGMLIISLVLFMGNAIWHANNILRDFGEDSIQYKRIFTLHRIAYPIASGIFGAQTVTLVRTVIRPDVDVHLRGFLCFCLLVTTVLQLYLLNTGLAHFESLHVVPVYTTTWIIFTILGGGIVYNEFGMMSYGQILFFIFAVGMCCFGVLVLSSSSSPDEKEEIKTTHQNSDEDSEDAAFPV